MRHTPRIHLLLSTYEPGNVWPVKNEYEPQTTRKKTVQPALIRRHRPLLLLRRCHGLHAEVVDGRVASTIGGR